MEKQEEEQKQQELVEQHKRQELERTKETTAGSIKSVGKIGQAFQRKENPDFLAKREEIFKTIQQRMTDMYAKAEKHPIKITLKDGKVLEGNAFQTCPQDIAKKISNKLLDNVFAAKVVYSKRYDLGFGDIVDADKEEVEEVEVIGEEKKEKYEIFDLHRPLEGDCTIELLDFEHVEGKSTFNHSSAHILGNVIEYHYGAHLCIGPPLKTGFYYDAYMGDEKVHISSYDKLEKMSSELFKKKLPFERVMLTKQEALELFQHNPFKVQLIQNKVPEGSYTSAYKVGSLIDLCTGPHIPHTGRIKAFKVTKNSSAYWLGNNQNDDLQRVYGVAFPKKTMLDEYIKIQEELAKRDHRNIGQTFDLFSFNHMAPGCAFFYPKGAHIYNKLQDMLRKQYKVRGYTEVITPNLYDAKLWKISGHWAKYKDNMFLVKGDDPNDQHGFKPMNCPGHCLMFDMKHVSYKDLPMRFADFGVLHRNELSGALSGLTRVRRFQQDDAHIFCELSQVADEIYGCLDFINYIYTMFGFRFELGLSTRPDNFLGVKEQWDQAEEALKEALLRFGKPFKINPKDGAFYGPKIDIELFDAFGRGYQCGTIQLDFQQPIRFNLQYQANETNLQVKEEKEHPIIDDVPLLKSETLDVSKPKKKKTSADISLEDDVSVNQSTITEVVEKKYHLQDHHLKAGYHRPVIVHRAVLGSLERFIAILCEQTAGKWPFWLSPRQIIILPITKYQFGYAEKVKTRLEYEGYNVVIDRSCHKIEKMVRQAQLNQYNFMFCVGKKEEAAGTVDIRDRDLGKSIGVFTIYESVKYLSKLQPGESDKERIMREKALELTNKDEKLNELNDSLQLKVYVSGEGFELGDQDKQLFEQYKDTEINKELYPNVYRWKLMVSKQLSN